MHTAKPARSGLRLADHVRACCVDGQVILLDLHRSKYIGVSTPQPHAWGGLADAIDGWPAPPVRPDLAGAVGDIDRYAAPLLAQGLLTRAPPRNAPHAKLDDPARSLNAQDVVATPVVGWRRSLRLLQVTAAISLQLRTRSLGSIAKSVEARRADAKDVDSRATREIALHEAVAAYLQIRLYVFTAHDRCLHDSLTLLRFLARENIHARWVIGVRVRPFGAHSWVQLGDTVLNDQHEHVRHYQPILVV